MHRTLTFLLLPLALIAAHPRLILLGGGAFDCLRPQSRGQFQLEYRSNYDIYETNWLFIRPLLGIMGTTKGALYGYGGIAFDFFLGRHVVFTPSFAPGLYTEGHDKALGFPLEYRSSLELSARFCNECRIGGQFYHISNGSVGWKNPGSESWIIFVAFPIDLRR